MNTRRKAQSVNTEALTALRERITEKSADYMRTSKAYKSKCVDGMAVRLISQAKVLDMVAGWVKELINAHQADTPAASASATEPTAPVLAEVATGNEADHGKSEDGTKLSDQGSGSVDLSGLRSGN